MKILKTLKTSTVAIAATAALAFCVTSAKAIPVPAAVTTSYDTVAFSATLITNISADFESGTAVTKSQKLVNKDLLNILAGPDFAGAPFPTGSKLVVSWDLGGDVVIVDKTGSNVLFDATFNNGNSSMATLAINPYSQTGAVGFNTRTNSNEGGNLSIAWYNNGTFLLMDQNAGVNIVGTGPCTERFNYKSSSLSAAPTWTDSQTFGVYGASETNGITGFVMPPGTLNGKITLSGHGKSQPEFLFEEIIGHFAPP